MYQISSVFYFLQKHFGLIRDTLMYHICIDSTVRSYPGAHSYIQSSVRAVGRADDAI